MQKFKSILIRFKLLCIACYWRFKYHFFRELLPRNADGKLYLNLGCGDRTGDEFINIDAVPASRTHYVQDIRDLSRFPDDSVDLIYASHVIEHLPRNELVSTLAAWRRVLKTGGVLRFGVPDFDRIIEMYETSGRSVEKIVRQLMGEGAPYDDHHSIWNRAYAERILGEAGYSSVRPWDPATADHHEFKDKTNRAYEVNGRTIPFSLNLEAVK